MIFARKDIRHQRPLPVGHQQADHGERLRSGSGTQAQLGVHTAPSVVQATRFGKEWLDTVMQGQNVAARDRSNAC